MDLHPDFRDLLAEFVRCGVKFAVLGGYAVGHHAKPRATKDLDLLVSAEGDNRERLAVALTGRKTWLTSRSSSESEAARPPAPNVWGTYPAKPGAHPTAAKPAQ